MSIYFVWMKDLNNNKTIVVRLMGGLGNQLFQLQFAIEMKKKYGATSKIVDTSYYNNYKIRSVEIDKICNNENIIFTNDYKDFKYFLSYKLFFLIQGVYRHFRKKGINFLLPYISKFGFFYTDTEVDRLPNNVIGNKIYCWGYFQDVNYITDLEEIRNYFSTEDFKKDISSREVIKIAISVRCGDDYISKGYPICDKEYYMHSIQFIEKKCKCKKQYILFTDDYEKAKCYLPENISYINASNYNPIDQLKYMAKCHSYILSNSSFAWWGAVLGEYNQKIVILPEYWDMAHKTNSVKLIMDGFYIYKEDF